MRKKGNSRDDEGAGRQRMGNEEMVSVSVKERERWITDQVLESDGGMWNTYQAFVDLWVP